MNRVRQTIAVLIVCLVLLIVGVTHTVALPAFRPQTPAENPQVTFNRDVAPIVFHYCGYLPSPGRVWALPAAFL